MLKVGILVDGQNSQYWNIDYIRLVQYILKKYECNNPEIVVKHMYACNNINQASTEKQYFWNFLEKNGFHVKRRDYNEGQKVDMDAQIGADIYKWSHHCDLLVLVAGDGDYLPVLNNIAMEKGQKFLVISRKEDTSNEFKRIRDIANGNIEVQFLDEIYIYKDGNNN